MLLSNSVVVVGGWDTHKIYNELLDCILIKYSAEYIELGIEVDEIMEYNTSIN